MKIYLSALERINYGTERHFNGMLTRDPHISFSTSEKSIAIARYTLAVDRRRKSDSGEQDIVNQGKEKRVTK